MRKALVFSIALLLVHCGCNRSIASGDKNLRITISKGSYSLSESINMEIIVTGEGVFFIGPCDRWFERQTDQGWKKVGGCPETDFVDLPSPKYSGDQDSISLPTSDTGNIYDYNYSLTPGVYRYAITYGISSGSLTCYSPEFEVIGAGTVPPH